MNTYVNFTFLLSLTGYPNVYMFQGEENRVILLSLVRSNEHDKIGFLSQQNRICVAISRAKCALYMFGDASTYRRGSKKWEVSFISTLKSFV